MDDKFRRSLLFVWFFSLEMAVTACFRFFFVIFTLKVWNDFFVKEDCFFGLDGVDGSLSTAEEASNCCDPGILGSPHYIRSSRSRWALRRLPLAHHGLIWVAFNMSSSWSFQMWLAWVVCARRWLLALLVLVLPVQVIVNLFSSAIL